MEDLAPPVRLALAIRYSLECGESVRTGVRQFIQENAENWVQEWFLLIEQGCETRIWMDKIKSRPRRNLLILLERGLQGESIQAALISLETELNEQALVEMEAFIGRLPFKMMLPLLFLVFPAYLLALLGPLLMQVISQTN